MTDDWIGVVEAARLLGSSRTTVWRSLTNPGRRAAQWGDEQVGWRHKPLSDPPTFQVSRARAEQLANGGAGAAG